MFVVIVVGRRAVEQVTDTDPRRPEQPQENQE
jgi:hypothetical protein